MHHNDNFLLTDIKYPTVAFGCTKVELIKQRSCLTFLSHYEVLVQYTLRNISFTQILCPILLEEIQIIMLWQFKNKNVQSLFHSGFPAYECLFLNIRQCSNIITIRLPVKLALLWSSFRLCLWWSKCNICKWKWLKA